MHISGLQKMTLLDFPGKVACTVFLQGCNFRCPFCHNSSLLGGENADDITQSSLLSFLQKRVGLLEAVVVSGGEPTLNPDLPLLLASIKALGFLVKLDTNGSRPDMVKDMAAQGLVDYVAMDVKNSREKYAFTAGKNDLDIRPMEETLRFLAGGTIPYELRTTVVQEYHTAKDIQDMGAWVSTISCGNNIPAWYIQPFADRDSVLCPGLSTPDDADLHQFKAILHNYAEKVEIRG